MPLHLLSKKSWNVYSPANIERVKRDEAEARRKAVEQEKRGLQNEADERLELLKQPGTRDRKSLKRKLEGEDDTDRDIRLAVEGTKPAPSAGKQDPGLALDANGHISLVPAPPPKRTRTEQEQIKDSYTVYLTDATGRDRDLKPTWYTSLEPEHEKWGDENPRRQQRELARLNADDPLAAMKKGVKALRENEKTRKDWMAQRERDLGEVERLAKKDRRDKKHEKRRGNEQDDLASLKGFSLEEGYTRMKASRDRASELEETYSHRHRHHGRSRRHRHESHSPRRAQDHHNRHRQYEDGESKRISQRHHG
ncbi:hypothetical protein A1O7_07800 [Cladophialophora yegresii CBS 114405]|uniref:CBF1-interacting co-repressor CIR N-terminal domain-containing protein n=1 Tax=Cladophialophora yegresii CBS 114405 TaxID=1182544 RepID=W9VP16_9EURO|nr:uncharacterized protein A1O7_07800 [Cladophialophora yegresii CBS 114405]EXJ57452.1 hypothetical protein A1O7_07800 [Cladophialophora yegresii CBS 114405]